ncbi:MAG TPA: hypothetical protein VFH26_08945 [Gemmatimonadales bacterium]|nr:hypothetical protein [Gemmatimonadales bacterium]
MDPTVALILGALWVLMNLFAGRKKTPPGPDSTEPPQPDDLPPDATQREGSRLEMVLREFQRSLESAEVTARRHAGEPLAGDEEIEERQSLEREPQIVSLEHEVRRPGRREYTQDAEAEQLVQRRIAAAATRDTARTKADHIQFDERIRKEPADQTRTRGYTAKQLRDAVVWREILGPPVSERGDR